MKARRTMCATCPFRQGSPYAHLQQHLLEDALSRASRICHSTGSTGFKGNTGKKELVCRGTRNAQIVVMCALGVIPEPTDAAWEKTWKAMQRKKAVLK